MKKFYLLVTGCCAIIVSYCQNPATFFTIANHDIVLPCDSSCTSFSVQVPHIKQTDDYVLTRPAYLPFAYTTPSGNELTGIYIDDRFSSLINLPFSFCFYGSSYNSLVVGSNCIISFDATNDGTANSWPLTTSGGSGTPVPIPYAGGTQNSSFSTYYPKASIMGPYHDIYPTTNGSGQRKIEWRVEGTAPNRRFIASYNSVPMFSCNSTYATSQMVIYEGTGIVEVYVHDKPVCTGWNEGLAILGIQNYNRDKAVAPEGKNCTVWGGTNIDSCYRFIPSGGTSKFKSAQLLLNGTVVATADTSSLSAGVLNLDYRVCPAVDSAAYVIKVAYTNCAGATGQDIEFTDTVYIKKTLPPVVTLNTTNASCSTGGTVTIDTTGTGAIVEFSIDGGMSYQPSTIFSNLPAGTYTILVRKTGSTCTASYPAAIAATNDLVLDPGSGGSICLGASFTPNVTGNATSYNWSPATGVSNPAIANPVISPGMTTTYTVTATLGSCTAQGTVTVSVFPGATASAGNDVTIIAGDMVQLQGNASAGIYTWSPSTGLSATNTLVPGASPSATTTYTLTVVTSQGCTASDDVTVTVVPYCVKPMEAFTPNGDGINDYWLVTNGTGCISNIKAEVFNRYGAKVFESSNYDNTWNGMYKGKPLPDGTYYYILSYKLLNGKSELLKGNVTILR